MKLEFNKLTLLCITSCLSINYQAINSHNSFNGGCKEHCGIILKKENDGKKIFIKNKFEIIDDSNSCLLESLCRG